MSGRTISISTGSSQFQSSASAFNRAWLGRWIGRPLKSMKTLLQVIQWVWLPGLCLSLFLVFGPQCLQHWKPSLHFSGSLWESTTLSSAAPCRSGATVCAQSQARALCPSAWLRWRHSPTVSLSDRRYLHGSYSSTAIGPNNDSWNAAVGRRWLIERTSTFCQFQVPNQVRYIFDICGRSSSWLTVVHVETLISREVWQATNHCTASSPSWSYCQDIFCNSCFSRREIKRMIYWAWGSARKAGFDFLSCLWCLFGWLQF